MERKGNEKSAEHKAKAEEPCEEQSSRTGKTGVADLLIENFVACYMEKLFYFCLKKTGDSTKAQDLTSDIALNVFVALRAGTVPEHFSAWVWKIARNRYSRWAEEKHQRQQRIAQMDIESYEEFCYIRSDSGSMHMKCII